MKTSSTEDYLQASTQVLRALTRGKRDGSGKGSQRGKGEALVGVRTPTKPKAVAIIKGGAQHRQRMD